MTPDTDSPKSATTWGDQPNEEEKFKELADEVKGKGKSWKKDGSWVHDMTNRSSSDPLPLRADKVSADAGDTTPGVSVHEVDSDGEHPNSPFTTGYFQDSGPYSEYSSDGDEVPSKKDRIMTKVFKDAVKTSGVDIQHEVDLAKRKALRAD